MRQVLFLFFFLFFLASCSTEKELEKLPAELSYFTYIPIECVNEPWENWYENSQLEFSKEPNDEEMITLFLQSEYEIDVYSLQKKTITEYVCTRGCALCPEGHQFIIKIEEKYSEQILKLGWKKVLSIQS